MQKDKRTPCVAAILVCAALLLCGPPAGTVAAIEFMDCDSKYSLESVDIEGCASAPCHIALNSTVNVTTHFKPVSDAASLTNNVYFSLNNARIVTTARPDPCSSLVCPVKCTPQKAYTYSSQVLVPATLPAISGELAWSLQDDQSVPVICFRVDIQLLPINTRTALASASSDSPEAQSSPGRQLANSPSGQSNSSDIHSGGKSNMPASSQHIPGNAITYKKSVPYNSMASSSKTSRLTASHIPLHLSRTLHHGNAAIS